MTTVYFAGPLFTAAERLWNAAQATAIRSACPAIDLRLPQEFCAKHDEHPGPDGRPDYGAIFGSCLAHLGAADIVVAVLDGPDVDSGTAWEMGHAAARGVPVIGWRTDWRPGEDAGCNCMLSRSCVAVLASLEEVVAELDKIAGSGSPD